MTPLMPLRVAISRLLMLIASFDFASPPPFSPPLLF